MAIINVTKNKTPPCPSLGKTEKTRVWDRELGFGVG
jgi:hypothetical protein